MRLSIRGSGIGNASHNRGTLLAQDGVPFNEADGFGDFQLIDPLIARYTEVYKGGNALRFGGALLGGAINLVTPTGRNAASPNLLRLDGGSYGTVRAHAEVARTSGDWDLFAAATGVSANGWRGQSDQTAGRLSLNFGRQFGDDREVRLIVAAADIQQEIPGSLTLGEALSDPRRPAAGNLLNEYQRNMRSVRAALQSRWRLSSQTVLEGGVYTTWKDLDHPIFAVVDQESRNFGAFARLDWTGEAFGRRADAFAGTSVRFGDLDARQWTNLKSSRGALTAQSRQNASAADLFAEGRLFFSERLAVVAGGSFGWADREFRDLRSLRTGDETYEWFAPRLGLLWESKDGAQLFANLTRSVEPPNFSALAQIAPGVVSFVPLKAQDASTAEVGARGRRGPLTWDVALYRAKTENELLNFDPNPGSGIPAPQFNAGPTVHQGVEAGLDWRFAERLRLRQTYSWSDFRFDGDPTYRDGRLPVVPQHLYRAELRYHHPTGWFVAPSLEWVPQDVFVDYRNTRKAPAYAVWSLNGGWRSDEGLELFVEVRNLADERYVSNFSAVTRWTSEAAHAVFFPGEGRSIYGGLAWRF